MSRLGNEDVRRTAGGILANLTEAENLKVKKSIFTDLNGTIKTKILEELVELKEGYVITYYWKDETGYIKRDGDNYERTPNKEDALKFATEDEADNAKEDINQYFGGRAKLVVMKESVEPAQPEGAEDKVPGEGKEPLAEESEEIVADEVIEEPVEDAGEEMTDDIAKATELIAKIFAGEVTAEEREAARAELTDMIAGEAEPAEGEDLPEEPVEGEEIVEEGCGAKKEASKVCEKCGKEPCECEGKEDLKEEDGDKIDEKICEGLEIVDVANNNFLLKESAGFIVGKNYNKATGLIEEAETYKTEKVARKAFERLSK